MNDPVTIGARAAANRLTADYGSELVTDVEAALQARGSSHPPQRYFDPVSLGELIVSIATLAWTVYSKLTDKKSSPPPEPDVIARKVRVELRSYGETLSDDQEEITEIVVTEIIRAGSEHADV